MFSRGSLSDPKKKFRKANSGRTLSKGIKAEPQRLPPSRGSIARSISRLAHQVIFAHHDHAVGSTPLESPASPASAARPAPRVIVKLGIILIATATLLLAKPASGEQINVLASGATKEAYVELVAEFEKISGHRVATTWNGSARRR